MAKLKFIKKKHSGRDSSGQVSVRHQGGEQKKFIRVIDFKRDKHMVGRVMATICEGRVVYRGNEA